MSKAVAGDIVACVGARISRECAKVIADFRFDAGRNSCHFIMKEWLSEDQFQRALLLWVVDSSTPWDEVQPALRCGVPLLVPEENRDLRHLCESASCGIWYADEINAQKCLNYLLTNNNVRQDLGANGRSYSAASANVSAQSPFANLRQERPVKYE